MLRLWPWLIAALFAAGIIHILAVFGVPFLATRDAWARRVDAAGDSGLEGIMAALGRDAHVPVGAPWSGIVAGSTRRNAKPAEPFCR